jgi:hypothetical protein
MMTRFYSLIQSPDAREGALQQSNYSTRRTPTTALLFEAKEWVILPLVRLEDKLPSTEYLPEANHKVACSFQEQ